MAAPGRGLLQSRCLPAGLQALGAERGCAELFLNKLSGLRSP